MTEQELFEQWAKPDAIQQMKTSDGHYLDRGMASAFAGWKARAKLAEASLPAAEDAPKIGPLTLAAIGRNHFGNPIPQEWYAAAKELLAMRAAEDARDKDRLDWLATEYIKVDPFEMPTGGGDADVGWRFSQYHCGKPREVVVHEHYKDDLREAIDAAMSQDSGKENGE